MQTRARSLCEAGANNVVAFVYAFGLNYTMLATMPFTDKLVQSFWITSLFTVASLIRQYYMRRFFEWLDTKYPPK